MEASGVTGIEHATATQTPPTYLPKSLQLRASHTLSREPAYHGIARYPSLSLDFNDPPMEAKDSFSEVNVRILSSRAEDTLQIQVVSTLPTSVAGYPWCCNRPKRCRSLGLGVLPGDSKLSAWPSINKMF